MQHVVKNEIITALIKPQMRIEASETVEAAPEPEQLELISETPAKKGKAKKKQNQSDHRLQAEAAPRAASRGCRESTDYNNLLRETFLALFRITR